MLPSLDRVFLSSADFAWDGPPFCGFGFSVANFAESRREMRGMPKLEIEGVGTFDVEPEKRLVLAIEEDAGVDIMHACGSWAKCTTCRVEFIEGEPEDMTEAEQIILDMRDLLEKERLSCQILCDDDMKLRVSMTVSGTKANDPGAKPEEDITPEPIWIERPY
jgi:ferredoxin